jgi:D-3-phosphoglycerate dehydrogenase / 2-oxoglutarate reductase
MSKVLIATAILAGLDKPFLHVLKGAGLEVVYPRQRKQLTEDELITELKGVAAALAGSEPYTRRVIESSPQLRVIARNGVGYDAVEVAAATEHGIAITVTPGANHESVAEHTFALMLTLARSIIPQHAAISAGRWQRDVGFPLRGRTLGLIGLGRIGREVAIRALAFRMHILAYEPRPDARFVAQHRIVLVPLEQLLSQSDFVSLHLPLTHESQHLLDGRALGLMKPTAFLLNTARGGLVDEAELLRALQERRIAGAGLDVFAEEPPPADHLLLKLPNVVCTAHTAGVDAQARDDMAHLAAQSIVALSRGQWSHATVVNPECRARFSWT